MDVHSPKNGINRYWSIPLSRSHVIIQGTPGTVSQVTSKYVSMVPRDGALATEKPRCALQKEIRNYQWTRYVAMVQDMCISLDFWWSLHMCVVSICVFVSLCVCVYLYTWYNVLNLTSSCIFVNAQIWIHRIRICTDQSCCIYFETIQPKEP